MLLRGAAEQLWQRGCSMATWKGFAAFSTLFLSADGFKPPVH